MRGLDSYVYQEGTGIPETPAAHKTKNKGGLKLYLKWFSVQKIGNLWEIITGNFKNGNGSFVNVSAACFTRLKVIPLKLVFFQKRYKSCAKFNQGICPDSSLITHHSSNVIFRMVVK